MSARLLSEGSEVGGVTVLKILNPEARVLARRYWVRYDCCGRAGELTHVQLRHRGRHAARCAECRASKRGGGEAHLPPERGAARELAMSGAWRNSKAPSADGGTSEQGYHNCRGVQS
jgi:hypothetical protein